MKLKSVRVRMYRNILDSTEVNIEDKVTCLVGKNESGKSAFLTALWRLMPARLNPNFSIPEQYPAWLEKRHRNEGINQEDVIPIEVKLEWEQSDTSFIEEKLGPGVVSESALLKLWKTYGNKFGWNSGLDEKRALHNFVTKYKFPEDEEKAYKKLENFKALDAKLDEDSTKYKDNAESLQLIINVQKEVKALYNGNSNFNNFTWAIVEERLPEFFYFTDYSKLPEFRLKKDWADKGIPKSAQWRIIVVCEYKKLPPTRTLTDSSFFVKQSTIT